MIDRVGQRLGNYQLLSLLGQGSFAAVYLGQHVHLQSYAAIKMLHTRLESDSLDEFRKEARLIASLRHPHIITIHDFDVEEDIPFLVMDYAPHGSLREFYPRGAQLPPSIILPYVKQVASALQYAHTRNIIHRDVKPANMLIGLQQEILLSDFGLAIMTQSSLHSSPQPVAGTLAYMAPEQLEGRPGPASDQYALAIAVYEWLAGTLPFVGTPEEMAALHHGAPPPPLRERVPTISHALEQVVMTALAKDPRKRFKHVETFADAFEKAYQSEEAIMITQMQSSTPSAAQSFPEPFPRLWNVPLRRNMFFTGREEIIKHIYQSLPKNKMVALAQAITGLGGIGKTQTVVEYAYRYRNNYRAVFWVRADTQEVLNSDFAALADLLNLREKKDQDQSYIILAVKRWLQEQNDWLLIFDNVEHPEMVDDMLPAHHHGHVLLTTRAQMTGPTAQRIELEKMPPHEGALFLLRRAQIIPHTASSDEATFEQRKGARDISIALDGIPLALDQAGSYIESTDCGLQGFLARYQQRQDLFLQKRGKPTTQNDHPASVATTLALCFEQVTQASAAAGELLQLCAFLYPDSIPEEIFSKAASELSRALRSHAGDDVKLDAAIVELRKYSLIRRNPEQRTLTIHRLVQAILKDRMTNAARRQWAERAVRAVNRLFPDVAFENWPLCERLLPHAQICAVHIEQWDMKFPEAIRLLKQTGKYLRDRAQYEEAEPLYQQTLTICEQTLGSDHAESTTMLDALADIYFRLGKYVLAESFYQQALDIRQKTLPPNHLAIAASLNYVARICYFIDKNKYQQAEQYFQQALAIREASLEPDDLAIAETLEDLANYYIYQGQYAKAEPLYQRSLAIRQQRLGPAHPEVGGSIFNLALLYHKQAKYDQAEPLYQQARTIFENAFGTEHPDVGLLLDDIAMLNVEQGKYTQAGLLFQQVLTIHEKAFGPVHPHIAKCLDNMALLSQLQGKYDAAESYARRALTIHEQTVGPEHTDVAFVLYTLARIYLAQAKYEQVRASLQRAVTLLERDQRPDNPFLGMVLSRMADLCQIEGRYHDANMYYQRGLAILQKSLGNDHLDVAESLHGIARLLYKQGQYEQAATRCQEVLALCEKKLGRDHPDVAHYINTLALILLAQDRQDEAEKHATRTLAYYEQHLGARHPAVAESLSVLARVYQAQGNSAKARPLYQRAVSILTHTFGQEHPDIARCLHGLATLAYAQGKYAQAEKDARRAVIMGEKTLGGEHPDVAEMLYTLAKVHQALHKYTQAEIYYRRAVTIKEHILGEGHPDTIEGLKGLAVLLRLLEKEKEAQSLEERLHMLLAKRYQEDK